MGSSEFSFLLFFLPNMLVGLAYLLFLKRPMKQRLLTALPSVLFLLIPVVGFSLAGLSIEYESLSKVLVWSFAVLGVGALASAFFNIVYIKTWLHLLQVVNIAFGCVIWYLASMAMLGDLS